MVTAKLAPALTMWCGPNENENWLPLPVTVPVTLPSGWNVASTAIC
jgi:hypothetical protein